MVIFETAAPPMRPASCVTSPLTVIVPSPLSTIVHPFCSTAALMVFAFKVPLFCWTNFEAVSVSAEITPPFCVRVLSEALMEPPTAVAVRLAVVDPSPTVVSDLSVTFSPEVLARMEIEFAPASSVTSPPVARTALFTVMDPAAVTEIKPSAVVRPSMPLTVSIARALSLSMTMLPPVPVASMAMVETEVSWLKDSTLMPSSSPESEPLPETDFAASEMAPSAVISALFWMTPLSVSRAVIETFPPVAPSAAAVTVPLRAAEPTESMVTLPAVAAIVPESCRTPAGSPAA